MKHRQRWKQAAAWVLALVLSAGFPLTLAGAVGAPNICYAYEKESDEYFWSWSVMVGTGEYCDAFTVTDSGYSYGSRCVLKSGSTDKYYTMDCIDSTVPDSRTSALLWWDVSGAHNDSAVLPPQFPVSGESVTVYYIVSSPDGASLESEERTITGASVPDSGEPSEAVLNLNRGVDATHYPGFVVNRDNECVGILYAPEKAFLFWYDEETFTAAGSGNNGNSETSGSNGTSAGSGYVPPAPASPVDWIREHTAGVIIAILAAGAGVIWLLMADGRKHKNGMEEKTGNTEITYPAPAAPDNPVPEPPVTDAAELYLSGGGGGLYDGRHIALRGSVITMGREQNSTVPFPDEYPGVSRTHAVLRIENGMISLEDSSTTGTYVKQNGQAVRIPPNQPVRLYAGDVFYLGEHRNRFEIVQSRNEPYYHSYSGTQYGSQ